MTDFGTTCWDALQEAKAATGSQLTKEQVITCLNDQYAKAKRQRLPAAPKQRNALFDALAEATGLNPLEVGKLAGGAIGVALADIRSVTPSVTAEEIHRRAREYKKRHRDWPLTATALAKHWAEFAPKALPPEQVQLQQSEPTGWQERIIQLYPAFDPTRYRWVELPEHIRNEILQSA